MRFSTHRMVNRKEQRHSLAPVATAIVVIATAGCYHGSESVLERMAKAQQRARDLHLHFSQVADATNLAVMADTDAASHAFASQARQNIDVLQKDADALRTLLKNLMFSKEVALLDQFEQRFTKYRSLDRTILDLSVENTNLKAQRLSIGPAQEAVEAFRVALEQVASGAPPNEAWHIKALTASALAAVREIQVLEAPHIIEADDREMTRIEKQMSASENAARDALKMLATLVPDATRPQVAASEAALTKYLDLHTQLLALSRRNSNVRSLSLALGELRMLNAGCEDDLRALQEAIGKRGFVATR